MLNIFKGSVIMKNVRILFTSLKTINETFCLFLSCNKNHLPKGMNECAVTIIATMLAFEALDANSKGSFYTQANENKDEDTRGFTVINNFYTI